MQLAAEASADATELLDRHVLENDGDVFLSIDCQAIGLFPFRGQLGEQLVRCDADGAGNTEARLDARLDQISNALNAAEEFERAAQIKKGLIDREDFHQRCVVLEQRHDLRRHMGIEPVVGRHQDQLGTLFKSFEVGHAGLHPESPRLVGSGQDDRALLAAGHRNRLAAQGRVGLLFDRGKERIHVDVHDGFHITPWHGARSEGRDQNKV